MLGKRINRLICQKGFSRGRTSVSYLEQLCKLLQFSLIDKTGSEFDDELLEKKFLKGHMAVSTLCINPVGANREVPEHSGVPGGNNIIQFDIYHISNFTFL